MPIEKSIKKNYDLAGLTTFRIGGQAEFFVMVKNKEELSQAINWARLKKLPLLCLAGGSNILITKQKIHGLVIKISGQEYEVKENIISSWAGTGLTNLAKAAADHGLSGLEWALGVPGSLGGAVRGNAGAYGSDISGQVDEVEAYDIARNSFVELDHGACGFSYRHSIFKENKNLLIANVKLKLVKGESREIINSAQRNFDSRSKTNPKEPSAGCVFKNLEYKKIIEENPQLAKDLEQKGLFRGGKIGAAYLIDQLGLKGETRGGAKISEKHANFIINTGQATPEDVRQLIKLVKERIKLRYKINLEEEIQFFEN